MNKAMFIFFFIGCQIMTSQNLVLNPSFEDFNTCPGRIGIFNDVVTNWSTPNLGSTDYFNTCSEKVGNSNFFGNQEPKTGKGYAGIYVMAPQNYREYIQGSLSNPLEIGKTYRITFYMSLAENCSHAIRDLGVLFLTEPLKQNSDKLINPNKILNEEGSSYFVLINSQDYYTQKSKWEQVTFEYTAKGFETNFIIGNFNNNDKTAKVKTHNSNNFGASYYYIDNVNIELFETAKSTNVASSSVEKDQLLERDTVYTLQNVLFDFNKHDLLESSIRELDELYNYLNNNKRLQIEIYGHTDDVGSEKRNNDLSLLRAKEVALYLISKGLRGERIIAKGFGNKFPIATNNTEEGRALNRRVEFKLIFK